LFEVVTTEFRDWPEKERSFVTVRFEEFPARVAAALQRITQAAILTTVSHGTDRTPADRGPIHGGGTFAAAFREAFA